MKFKETPFVSMVQRGVKSNTECGTLRTYSYAINPRDSSKCSKHDPMYLWTPLAFAAPVHMVSECLSDDEKDLGYKLPQLILEGRQIEVRHQERLRERRRHSGSAITPE